MRLLRTSRERPAEPLHGFKLAHPVLSSDGSRAGFGGVTLGRGHVYGVVADAMCAQGGAHRSPSRWCDCGFYCLHSVADAEALACDPDYRSTVLLEVVASGRFLRYERGLRYSRQRVTRVRIGRCGCGRPGQVLVHVGTGQVGWRQLVAVCATCASGRPFVTLSRFSELLDRIPVVSDGTDTSAEDTDQSATVSLLSAEVALLQARLDEVQRHLARLTDRQS